MNVFGAVLGSVVATVFGGSALKWWNTRATVVPKADLKHERTLQNIEDGVRVVGDIAIGAGVDTTTLEANAAAAAAAKPQATSPNSSSSVEAPAGMKAVESD